MWTFARKVMSLLFNMLSRFVIASLARSKHHLISWLQSLSAVSPGKSVTIPFFLLLFAIEFHPLQKIHIGDVPV